MTPAAGSTPHHHFILALQEIPIAPSITVNSIIAVEGDGPVAQGNDGVVAYSSAHIDGVESEVVVRSPHSHRESPKPSRRCAGFSACTRA